MTNLSFARAACACALLYLSALPALARDWSSANFREPAVTQPGHREWAWDGGDRLAVGVPAVVHYSEKGAPRVVINGPEDVLRQVRFGDGVIASDEDLFWARRQTQEPLDITVSGVALNEFVVSGSGRLLLGKLARDHLAVIISGSGSASMDGATVHDAKLVISGSGKADLGALQAGHVMAQISGSGSLSGAGHADDIDLKISGAGDAHFGALSTTSAEVDISGSGKAEIAPRDEAQIRITGSGTVRMDTKPAKLETTIRGSGHVMTAMADRN
ncbi:MAG TPA: DUF2807 domain-containing protein [Rhizomicrobium sp.]|jgi:hypothetical protein|nr:DUF2807 domain-containing protein [Rhizomicrobium sp.]